MNGDRMAARACGCLLAVLLASGCGRNWNTCKAEPGKPLTNQVERLMQSLGPRDLVVRVNNHGLTRAQYDVWYAEACETQIPAGLPGPQERDKREQLKMFTVANYITRAVLIDEAERRQIEATSNDVKMASNFVRQLQGLAKLTAPLYAQRWKDAGMDLGERQADEARLVALFRAQEAEVAPVTREEAEKMFHDLAEGNKASEVTNGIRRATLQGHVNAVKAGLFIPAPAKKEGEVYVDVALIADPADLPYDDNEEFINAIKRLKPDEWTAVLEMPETFECYHRMPGDSNTWQRYSIDKDLGYQVMELDDLQKDMTKGRVRGERQKWIQGLVDKSAIVYPNGVSWFPRKK